MTGVTCQGEISCACAAPFTVLLVLFRSLCDLVTVTTWAVGPLDDMLVVETFRVTTLWPPPNDVSWNSNMSNIIKLQWKPRRFSLSQFLKNFFAKFELPICTTCQKASNHYVLITLSRFPKCKSLRAKLQQLLYKY